MGDTPASTETAQPQAPLSLNPPAGAAEVVVQPSAGTGEGKTLQVSQPVTEGDAPPQWVKDAGFETFEAFKEAYDKGELDPATGKKKAEAPAEGDPAKPQDEGDKPKSEDPLQDEAKVNEVKARLKEAGGIYADPRYEQGALEFELTGDVKGETRDQLAKDFAVDRSVVDQYIEGQKAQRALQSSQAQEAVFKGQAELHKIAGGEAEYGKFQGWANENLSDGQRDAYNRALQANDVGTASALLQGYFESYKSAGNGPGPRDITSEGSPSSRTAAQGPQAYASQAEMEKDMGSKQYRDDPAFREKVKQRIALSSF